LAGDIDKVKEALGKKVAVVIVAISEATFDEHRKLSAIKDRVLSCKNMA